MHQDSAHATPRWRTCFCGGILASLLFLAVWVPLHPARSHLPTSDLYTHLTVARHLARGEGFLTDVTYPLSFAFPFAQKIPQPLIHRQPGFAILLTAPYFAGGGYAGRALDQVRWMQVLFLGVILGLGTTYLFRRRNHAAVLPWLLLMFFNPLLVFAVDWGMVELACALILLTLWLRVRGPAPGRPNWIDGLAAGALAMLRLDLFWVPMLWWVLHRGLNKSVSSVPAWPTRRLGLMILAWVLITAPWAARNLLVTGQPIFSVQAFAEHVKDTRSWPGYSVYQQLEPQAVQNTLTADPVPVLRKVGRGVRFYLGDLHRLIPLPALAVLLAGVLTFLIRRWQKKPAPGDDDGARPTALAVLTTVLLIIQYSVFDHSLRHLLVMLPILLWEVAFWVGTFVPAILASPARRFRLPSTSTAGITLSAAAAIVFVFLFPCRIPGWESAAGDAVALEEKTASQIDALRRAPTGVLFVDSSAIPWFIDHPVVWSPADEAVRHKICEILGEPEANPEDTP